MSGADTAISSELRRGRCMPLGRFLVAALAGPALFLAACGNMPSPLNVQGPGAGQINQVWWLMFGLATAVFLFTTFILLYGAFRRPGVGELEDRYPFGTVLFWIGGVIIPLAVLGTVFAFSIQKMVAYSQQSASTSLTVEVIGHEWWWEVRYPAENITTANEIHIPAGQRVRVNVSSGDVIHGFSVPELQGKIDALPGEANSIWIEAPQPGTYSGRCLVYCGLQHANMNFLVIADSPDQYAAWVSDQQSTPSVLTDATLIRGQQVFLGAPCAYCHTIAGTNATGKDGPDLTHLASRQTIAADTLPNTPGSLGGWVIDPQGIKPGNKMPDENFNAGDLQALLQYLQSLK